MSNPEGRPKGSTKISASVRIAGLTDRMAAMIESQINSLNKELAEHDKILAKGEYNPQASLARVEIATQIAALLKTLMQIQKLRSEAGEEDGDSEGSSGDGEAIVRQMLGVGKKK